LIRITIPSGRYTLEELRKRLEKRFKTDEDLEAFITAMQETNQLIELKEEEKEEEEKGKPVFVTAERRAVKRVTPKYLRVPPEEEVMGDRINRIYVFRWTYYTYKGRKLPRIAIRAGKNWVEKYGIPERAILYAIEKEGRKIRIPEKPVLRPAVPRYPETIEAYRAEIPRAIVRKYGITRDTPCYVRLEYLVTHYYATLQLWGYVIQVMISFGETKGGVNPRTLELIGSNMVYPTSREIIRDMKESGEKVEKLLREWLYKFNPEYAMLLELSDEADTTETILPEAIPKEEEEEKKGTEVIPLKEREERVARIIFRDPNRGIPEIAIYETYKPYDHIPPLSAFRKIRRDTINYALTKARGVTKLLAERGYTERHIRNLLRRAGYG